MKDLLNDDWYVISVLKSANGTTLNSPGDSNQMITFDLQ